MRVQSWVKITVLLVWTVIIWPPAHGRALFHSQPAILPIGAIQGNAPVSPYLGQTVTFRGVVTGAYADRNSSGITYHTLFVQDQPGHEDGDPATSDGIAVFTGRRRPLAQIGDLVRVTGVVTEFYGLTEIDDRGQIILVEASGAPLPEAIAIQPPADNQAQAVYFEPLEGMRVMIDGAARVVGPTFSGCSFAVVAPDVSTGPILRQRLTDPVGHIVPILHTNDVDCSGFPDVKTGDRVTGLVGPLIYHFDQFKLVQQLVSEVAVTAVPPPPLPGPPLLSADQISIVTYNVQNYFDGIDDTGLAEEPKPSPAELAAKQHKIAAQISQILGCPTLIGIQEVENAAMLAALVQLLQTPCGFPYNITHLESPDMRGIDVALLNDPRHSLVHNAVLQQTCTPLQTDIHDDAITCPAGQHPLSSRPPLQVDLSVYGRDFTLLINHFKSKRGGEAESAPQRQAQAQHINNLAADLLAANPDARLVVMGDFNDYELSEPLQLMTTGGHLTNPLSQIPANQRYSFIFGGAAQLIDGILISPALVENVVTAAIQHVNADFPDSWGDDPQSLYRATDHDLPLLVLNLADTPTTAVSGRAPAAPLLAWLWLAGLAGLLCIGGTAVWLRRRHPAKAVS